MGVFCSVPCRTDKGKNAAKQVVRRWGADGSVLVFLLMVEAVLSGLLSPAGWRAYGDNKKESRK
jgi:hypothetical protein